jgi:hypothetical protein
MAPWQPQLAGADAAVFDAWGQFVAAVAAGSGAGGGGGGGGGVFVTPAHHLPLRSGR